MKAPTRRILAVTILALLSPLASAQGSYPDKPITLVVASAPAGGTDTIGRFIGDRLSKVLKQTVVIENRAGANGVIATDYVIRSPADGYRLLFTYTAAQVVNPAIMRKPPYDPVKDLAPVGQIGRAGNFVVVNPQLPVKNFKELVDYAKARPDQLSYCSWGTGSGGHLLMEYLKKQAGLVMTHIPYKGTAPCVQDVIGGQLMVGTADISSTVELVRSGKLRAIGYGGSSRLPRLPDVPTLTESGYTFNAFSWYGIFAPAATPKPIVQKLNAALQDVLKDPATLERLAEFNFVDVPISTSEQFAETVRRDAQLWGDLAKSLNLVVD